MPKTCTIILIASLGAYCGCQTAKNKTTVSTVENDIKSHLLVGSPKAEVCDYLDKRKIDHAWLEAPQVSVDGNILIPDSHIEEALIRDVRMDFLIRTDIQIQFKFDEGDSNMVSYAVREVYTGP